MPKGKEMEQERKGKISNPDIDLERTNLNFDFVDDKRTLYQRKIKWAIWKGKWFKSAKEFCGSGIQTILQYR